VSWATVFLIINVVLTTFCVGTYLSSKSAIRRIENALLRAERGEK
jgi:hypothetical protein